MLTLTDSAQAAVSRFMEAGQKSYKGLRIGVTASGCSGNTYAMALEETATEDDILIECGAVTLILDPESAPLLSGMVVDFVESVEGRGFTFDNPNAASTCGCGKSFSSSCATKN
ncbi:iron-sulfur cluster assembly accessory protein [Magnetospira thiophila]